MEGVKDAAKRRTGTILLEGMSYQCHRMQDMKAKRSKRKNGRV